MHRYSDLLGFQEVPTIDDLYDDRIALLDLTATALGVALLFGSDYFDLASSVAALGGAAATLGFGLFAANVILVLRRHSPHSLLGPLFDTFAAGGDDGESTAEDSTADAGD